MVKYTDYEGTEKVKPANKNYADPIPDDTRIQHIRGGDTTTSRSITSVIDRAAGVNDGFSGVIPRR